MFFALSFSPSLPWTLSKNQWGKKPLSEDYREKKKEKLTEQEERQDEGWAYSSTVEASFEDGGPGG